MLGVWLLIRGREQFGTVAVAMATLVKPYAVLVLPVFWRPWDWRVPLAAVVTAGLCYLPYAGAGRDALGYLASGYLSEEGLASGEGFWLIGLVQAAIGNVPGLTTAYLVAAAVTIAWLALRAPSHRNASPAALLQRVALLLMVGLLLLSPNYPWYVLAVVPFTVLGGGVPAWAMTLGAILLYRPWLLPENDLAWKTLATLPVIVAAAYVLAWRRRDSVSFRGASQWTS
jgi:alpha-1,6-mannosyltransferase